MSYREERICFETVILHSPDDPPASAPSAGIADLCGHAQLSSVFTDLELTL